MTTVLVDVPSLASRAFYVGQPKFFDMVNVISQELGQPKFVFCFDGARNWRKTVYPAYKANRKDPNKAARVAYFRTLWAALSRGGQACLYVAHLEADDLIAALAKTHGDSLVLTSDKDLLGVIAETTRVYLIPAKFHNRMIVDRAWFQQEWGFPPEHFYTWKALAGDVGDNIKGVPGIGPKGATVLVKLFGNDIIGGLEDAAAADWQLRELFFGGLKEFKLSLELVQPRIETLPPAEGQEYNEGIKQIWRQLKLTQTS